MKLNVGCGGVEGGLDPFKGFNCEVNCDIGKPRERISNFVLCDACHLPFVDKKFDVVIASHILEHLINPYIALSEWKRVGNNVVVKVPNLSHVRVHEYAEHIYTWSESSFRNLLSMIFDYVEVHGSWRQSMFLFDLNSTKGKLLNFLVFSLYKALSFFKTNELTAVCSCRKISK